MRRSENCISIAIYNVASINLNRAIKAAILTETIIKIKLNFQIKMKIVAILLASIASTKASQLAQDGPIEYEFSSTRCGEWRLSQANECDESCMGTDDDTVGCS